MQNHDKNTLPGRLHPEVIAYLIAQAKKGGAKGGLARSSAKTAAARANAKRPRQRKNHSHDKNN